MIIGALVGAVAGLIAGALVIQRAEETQSNPKLTAGDGVKVGLGVLALLRQVGDLGGRK